MVVEVDGLDWTGSGWTAANSPRWPWGSQVKANGSSKRGKWGRETGYHSSGVLIEREDTRSVKKGRTPRGKE